MPRAGMVIPYFSHTWPPYVHLFFASCFNNDWIDFLVFSNLPAPGDCPPNVLFFDCQLEDLTGLFCRKLNLNIPSISPYKLCDFKPAYGLIFGEKLECYDFWGHCDLDLVLGRISHILGSSLSDHDIISCRREWISGAFTLYRNLPFVNELFKVGGDYAKVFTDKQHFAFDECGGAFVERLKGISWNEINPQITNMTKIVEESAAGGDVRALFSTVICESIPLGGFVEYNRGIVSRNELEFAAYHLITEKKLWLFSLPDWQDVPDHYFLNRLGSFSVNDFSGTRYFRRFLDLWGKLPQRMASRFLSRLGTIRAAVHGRRLPPTPLQLNGILPPTV